MTTPQHNDMAMNKEGDLDAVRRYGPLARTFVENSYPQEPDDLITVIREAAAQLLKNYDEIRSKCSQLRSDIEHTTVITRSILETIQDISDLLEKVCEGLESLAVQMEISDAQKEEGYPDGAVAESYTMVFGGGKVSKLQTKYCKREFQKLIDELQREEGPPME